MAVVVAFAVLRLLTLSSKRWLASDGERLGAWVQEVRLRYKTGGLNQERIDRLEALARWQWRTR